MGSRALRACSRRLQVPGLWERTSDPSMQDAVLCRLKANYSTHDNTESRRTNLCSAVNDALHIVMENDPRFGLLNGLLKKDA